MKVTSIAPGATPPGDAQELALRKSARDMESLFVEQLYKAMRSTVPTEGGLVERSQGEDLFSGLMDERVAAETGSRWQRGLQEAIYAALSRKVSAESPSR